MLYLVGTDCREEISWTSCANTSNHSTSWTSSSVSGGKLLDPDSGIREGIGSEVGELESWVSDDGASRHMTSSHDSMTNYRECSGIVRTAGGDVLLIEGFGDILLRFLSDSGAFDI